MNTSDFSDIHYLPTDSRLLSEASLSTGPGGDDLSLSELSLNDRALLLEKPFSLLAQSEPTIPLHESEENAHTSVDEEKQRHAAKLHEEKLQSDIFILKKLNASFAMFNEALGETGLANERVAVQLQQTDALLNKYVSLLSKSEELSKLIFDEQWRGADDDEQTLEREQIEAQEKARREAEERDLAAAQEQERREREERERSEKEEKERLEREKTERAATRGVRGVRGTRASMRGSVRGARGLTNTRVATPEGSTSRAPMSNTSTNQSTAIPSKRIPASGPTRSSSSRGTGRLI